MPLGQVDTQVLEPLLSIKDDVHLVQIVVCSLQCSQFDEHGVQTLLILTEVLAVQDATHLLF